MAAAAADPLAPQEAAAPAPVTIMPLMLDAAATLQREAEIFAASQGNVRLTGHITVSAGDLKLTVDRVKLSAWSAHQSSCAKVVTAVEDGVHHAGSSVTISLVGDHDRCCGPRINANPRHRRYEVAVDAARQEPVLREGTAE